VNQSHGGLLPQPSWTDIHDDIDDDRDVEFDCMKVIKSMFKSECRFAYIQQQIRLLLAVKEFLT